MLLLFVQAELLLAPLFLILLCYFSTVVILHIIVCPLLFLYFKVSENILSWDISLTCCFLFLLMVVPDFLCLWWNWSPKRLGVSSFLIFVQFHSLSMPLFILQLYLLVLFILIEGGFPMLMVLVSCFLDLFWFSSLFCWFCFFAAASFVIFFPVLEHVCF